MGANPAGNGLGMGANPTGTGWNGRESGREQPGGYLLRLGKKLGEHLCPGSGRRLGASASRPEETAPGAGRSTLLAAASHSGSFATRLSKIQQFHNSAMPHFDDSEPNGSALRRCFIPKVLAPAASHSGSFAARWVTIQQRHNSAMLHSGGSEPNGSVLRRRFIPKVLGPTASHSGSFATRRVTIQQRHNSAMPHSGVCNPIVRAPAAAAANFPLMPGRQPKRRGAQQGTSQKKSKSYSI